VVRVAEGDRLRHRPARPGEERGAESERSAGRPEANEQHNADQDQLRDSIRAWPKNLRHLPKVPGMERGRMATPGVQTMKEWARSA